MASFAKVSLLGNLGADPETKYTPSGTMVVELRIAVNPRPRGQQGQDEARPTWYRVSAWDRLADRIDKLTQNQHLRKGSQLFVEGKLEPREYTANDGQTRVSYDVTMTDFQFVGERRDGEQGSGGNAGGAGGYSSGSDGDSSGGNDGNNRRQTYNDSAPNDLDDIPF
jgi:single-strand DNA-binding protein